MNRIRNNNNNILQILSSAKSSGQKRTYFNIQVFLLMVYSNDYFQIGSILHGMGPIKQCN